MKKNILLLSSALVLISGALFAFRAANPDDKIYITDDSGRCTVEVPRRTTIENPEAQIFTYPSATTEFDGVCAPLTAWESE